MADPASVEWSDIAKGAWGIVVTILGWIGVTTKMDLAQLQRDAVIKSDHEKTIDRIEDTIKEHRRESSENFERVFERLDKIMDWDRVKDWDRRK